MNIRRNTGNLTRNRLRRRSIGRPSSASLLQQSGVCTCTHYLLVLSFVACISAEINSFCAIADIPYTKKQESILIDQLQNDIPEECAFLIHLGDLRANDGECLLEQYERTAEILSLSPIPVFVTLGDNDWNDCPNPDEGIQFFKQTFENFDTKYWNHNLKVTRHPTRGDLVFAIEFGETLLFGLQLVGGLELPDDHVERLTDQYDWTSQLIREYKSAQEARNRVGRVVVAAHVDPSSLDAPFFLPLQSFIMDELENQLPILYLHGDNHVWRYEPNFYGQSSFLAIQLAGEGFEPPTVIRVNNNGLDEPTDKAFLYDRQFPVCNVLFLPFWKGVKVYTYVFGRCVDKCAFKWEQKRDAYGWTVGDCPS